MVSQPRVLVIDDEESVRDAFADALEDLPYVVEAVSDGEEALKKAKSSPADLVFLDLKMPGMDASTVNSWIVSRLPRRRGWPSSCCTSPSARRQLERWLWPCCRPLRTLQGATSDEQREAA